MATCMAVLVFPILFTICLIFSIVKKKKGWVVAAVIFGLLMIGMLVLMATGTIKGIENAAKQAGQPKTAYDKQRSISIEIPGDWSYLNLNTPDAILQVGNLYREEFLLIIAESKLDFDETVDGESFARLASNLTFQALVAGSRSRLQVEEINGMTAWQCEMTGWDADTEIAYFNTYIEGPRHFYQILGWTTDPAKKKRTFPRFRSSVVTFRELK